MANKDQITLWAMHLGIAVGIPGLLVLGIYLLSQ
jgi:hypothetical protein